MAKKVKAAKPTKKTTDELMEAINKAMASGTYYFTDHGDKRSKTRKKVSDLEVIKILEGNDKWHEAKKISIKKEALTGTIISEERTLTAIKSGLHFLLIKTECRSLQ